MNGFITVISGPMFADKTKKLGYRKNYYKVYCVDCAKEYWEWRNKHFWFCAEDCLQ